VHAAVVASASVLEASVAVPASFPVTVA